MNRYEHKPLSPFYKKLLIVVSIIGVFIVGVFAYFIITFDLDLNLDGFERSKTLRAERYAAKHQLLYDALLKDSTNNHFCAIDSSKNSVQLDGVDSIHISYKINLDETNYKGIATLDSTSVLGINYIISKEPVVINKAFRFADTTENEIISILVNRKFKWAMVEVISENTKLESSALKQRWECK